MRALAFDPAARSLALVSDLPTPAAEAPDSLLVSVLEVGVCGTDREIVRGLLGTPPEGSPYLVLGHEMLGRVVSFGASVSGFAVGDLVVFTVRRPCGLPTCAPCARGESDLCVTDRYTERGIRSAHGFATSLVSDSAAFAVRVDPALRPFGVLLEPLTIVEKALSSAALVQRRVGWSSLSSASRALVIGAGPVGLLASCVLLLRGIETHVSDLLPASSARAQLASALGAVYDSGGLASLDFDLVFEATGSPAAAWPAVASLAADGLLVMVGLAGPSPHSVDGGELMRRLVAGNRAVLGAMNANRSHFALAASDLALMARRWPAELERMIVRKPLSEAPELLAGPVGEQIKTVLEIPSA